jgi:acetyl esterase/lipase
MLHARCRSPIVRRIVLRFLAAAILLVPLPACRRTEVRLYGPSDAALPPRYKVAEFQDVLYYRGPGADSGRHRLDLFLPRGLTNYPIVLLVHGGAWMVGNNRCSGLYTSVGEFLASQGIGAVLPNYRLSPGVKHPEHVKDVARAFAWVHTHISKLGGQADRIFIAGHSAGGHLGALLATNERYLAAEGLHTRDIRGVITFSGVFEIPDHSLEIDLGGDAPDAFRLDELLPFRGMWNGITAHLPGIPMHLDVFGPAFGDDLQARAEASPRQHVRPGLPPFLILVAEKDLPTLTRMATEFHRVLGEQGNDSRLVKIPGSNHNSIIFRAIEPDDPAARTVLAFIRELSRQTSP